MLESSRRYGRRQQFDWKSQVRMVAVNSRFEDKHSCYSFIASQFEGGKIDVILSDWYR